MSSWGVPDPACIVQHLVLNRGLWARGRGGFSCAGDQHQTNLESKSPNLSLAIEWPLKVPTRRVWRGNGASTVLEERPLDLAAVRVPPPMAAPPTWLRSS